MRFTLFDEADLKALEDTLAKAMARALISALKVAVRDGLLAALAEAAAAVEVPEEVPIVQPVQDEPDAHAQRTHSAQPEPATLPESLPDSGNGAEPPPVPRFLKPPPEMPYPLGKAVEPPPAPKGSAKTKALYARLYKTVEYRPEGFITTRDAVAMLGPNSDAILSTWLQKGQLEAVIVASITPPTKGLPGRLMISKQSLRARDKLRAENRKTSPGRRASGMSVAA